MRELTRRGKRRLSEWIAYVYADLPIPPPEKRFIYWAQPRTGSHLLADLLNCHPDLLCFTEHRLFFKREQIKDPYKLINGVAKRARTSIFGGKVTVAQLQRQCSSVEATIARLHHNGWRFIALSRHNLLEQTLSAHVANHRQQFHDTQDPTIDDLRTTIDTERLLTQLEEKVRVNQQTQTLLAPYPHLTVFYEDDLQEIEQQQQTADRIFRWLGVAPAQVHTRFKKSRRYPLAKYIENYDEVVAAVCGTPYANFLDESSTNESA